MITPQDKQKVREALALGGDIVLISEPGSDECRLLDADDGFFAVPWLCGFADGVRIDCPPLWRESTPKEYYLQSVENLIDELTQTGGKTVISRTICGTNRVDAVAAAEQYFAANVSAFCCLLSLRGVGTWLIATPELLLQSDGANFSTMALAGTRAVNADGDWSEKNIAEQCMVADFITDVCSSYNISVCTDGPFTRQANRVEHLCTMISGRLTEGATFREVASRLSPTPALCGLPRDVSCRRIAAIERHQRQLYGGFVGWGNGAESRAYVVLRCARIESDGWCVYAGGGITAQSDADDEWRETELKSAALVEILKNN